MPDSYFPLVRREPFIVGFWRQNDINNALDATDYALRYGLTGVYTNRSVGPALIQNDTSSQSSALGTTGYMSVADVAQLRITGDLSVEAWFTTYTAGASINLISKQNSGATTAGPYALKLVNGIINFSVGNGSSQTLLSGGFVLPSLPTHICATSFRGILSIYLNGSLVNSMTKGSQTVTDQGQALIVGKTSTEPGPNLISEVAIYNGALSARRVARHFSIGAQVLSNPSHYNTVDPPVIAV